MDEIYYELKDIKSDPNSIRRYIYRMMMKLRVPAAYCHSSKDNANEKAINAFFACIMKSIQKAITMLEALGYTDTPPNSRGSKFSNFLKFLNPSDFMLYSYCFCKDMSHRRTQCSCGSKKKRRHRHVAVTSIARFTSCKFTYDKPFRAFRTRG